MDWKLLITDLKAYGLSRAQVASECKCGQATISELATGQTSDPRHGLGEKLRALHKKHARKNLAAQKEGA